jgi:transposase InsO family protein
MADYLRTDLATAALQMALTASRSPPGLVHHSDVGGQYVSVAYVAQFAAAGAMSSVG